MISNLIVFSTLFLGVLFTAVYIIRPEFRARVEQPKHALLQQLSMYDKTTEAVPHDGKSDNKSNTKPVARSQ